VYCETSGCRKDVQEQHSRRQVICRAVWSPSSYCSVGRTRAELLLGVIRALVLRGLSAAFRISVDPAALRRSISLTTLSLVMPSAANTMARMADQPARERNPVAFDELHGFTPVAKSWGPSSSTCCAGALGEAGLPGPAAPGAGGGAAPASLGSGARASPIFTRKANSTCQSVMSLHR